MIANEEQLFRCFCARRPILGVVKQTSSGKPVFHIRIYKQQRVFGEIFLESGRMQFRCRDCYRMHRITIIRTETKFTNGDYADLPADTDPSL